MELTIGKHAGFCYGVKEAVRLAVEACEKEGACQVLGELIHNEHVMGALRRKGLSVANTTDEIAGGTVIIRSHGATPETYKKLEALGASIIDATCPNVERVHRVVSSGEEDTPVIIAGEPSHPEIQATAAWCKGPVHMVQNAGEALLLPAMERALVVAQTTLPEKIFLEIVAVLQKRIRLLDVKNTICRATHDRQMEAEALARNADVVLVLGGKSSANTKALYETCKRHCERTYWLESAADIPTQGIRAVDHIAITAGASTPEWSLKEVATRMNDLENSIPMEAETQPVVGEELAVTNETAHLPAEETSSAVREDDQPVAAEAMDAPVPDESAADATPMEETPPKANPVTAENSFMADIEATMVAIRPGQTITGTVVQITEDEVCVNIGYKSDGLVKRNDLVTTEIAVGDQIEVEVVKVNDGEGNVILSQRNIINRRNWEALMERYERGEFIEGVGKEAVKGGLIASVGGVRAFIPASQLSQRYVERVEDFVGKELQLKVIEVDKAKKRIVCSRKAVMQELAAQRKKEIWGRLEVGAVITGIVRRLTDFGVFVDVGGVDGLVHVTDLSWGRVRHPSEVVSPNQEISVKILSLDMERERIQLGYKQTQRRPWEIAEEKYPVGSIVEGRVVRITTFGAFVELEPGLDGLVHISQCALTRIAKVEDAVQVGQTVRVKVLNVDPQAKRISLSVRAALEEEAFNYSDALPGDDMMAEAADDVYATPVDYSQHEDEAE